MQPFVGREREMKTLSRELDAASNTGEGRFVWMRGRRRVGKSRLVQELCDASGARYCFFQAPRRARPDAIADFVEAVRESSLVAAGDFADASYASWPAALRAAAHGATAADPAILVIDELPYLVEHDDGFTADLQKAWDRWLGRAPILLICVGSDVRMMQELMQERSPLHGRPTVEAHVTPLSPRAVAEITAAPSAADAIDRYLVVGGFPLLAATWPSGATLEQFLADALAGDQTPFVTSALRIMSSELQQELQARRVIAAIGHGETAHGRIASRSGVAGTTLSHALEVLVDQKQMVHRALPYAAPPGRNPARYTVADSYLRFWLRFVGAHLDELARGRPDLVIARIVRDWPAYRGRAVEPVVRASVERLLAEPGLERRLGGARHIGSWWKRDHSIEVDLVGGDAPDPTSIGLLGSIKWHERARFDAADAARLAAARAAVPGATAAKLLAVTRTGVDPAAEVDGYLGPEDMLAAW